MTTNLREFSDRIVDWPATYHGAALASVALAMGDCFSTFRISASDTYRDLSPWGSHPLTDPLWSTETLSFIHDGLEAGRLAKARALVQFPQLLAGLRVCTTGEETLEYNCGRCEKCLRTALELYVVGALDACQTLPHQLSADGISRIRLNPVLHGYYAEVIESLGTSAFDEQLRESIHSALSA